MDELTFNYILSNQNLWGSMYRKRLHDYKVQKAKEEKVRVKERLALLPVVPKKLGRPKTHF